MTIRSEPLKTPQELTAMLKQLPEREQLRVEGVLIGLLMRDAKSSDSAPRPGS